MMDDPSNLAELFQQLGQIKGPIGLVALLIFLTIRLYRLPQWQDSLPSGMRWENFSVALKYAIIAILAGIGGALTSISEGVSWQTATTAAVTAALAAILTNKITKTEPARAVANVVVPQKPVEPVVIVTPVTPPAVPPV